MLDGYGLALRSVRNGWNPEVAADPLNVCVSLIVDIRLSRPLHDKSEASVQTTAYQWLAFVTVQSLEAPSGSISPFMVEEDREFLLKQAARCRNLLKHTTDQRMHDMLSLMAREYEERAESLKDKR